MPLIYSAFIGTILFLLIYYIYYNKDILNFKTIRIGSAFGDENDVALFMSFGLVISLYFIFFSNKIYVIIPSIILFILFTFAALTTGSKIFILIAGVSFIVMPFLRFRKEKWWIALVIVITGIITFLVILNLPSFKIIKDRMLDFVSTLFGKSIKGGDSGEYSTIHRLNMFSCGLEMFLRKPLFGWGIWGFATFSGRGGGWSHNNISESLCNFGLIGTTLFHFGLFVSLRNYFKSKRKENYVLPFILILFYLIAMISVALNSQKLYAYIIGLVFASFNDYKPLFTIKTTKVLSLLKLSKKSNNEVLEHE